MTLIVTVQTKGSLWLLADRRLSAPNRRPIDDAVKATVIEVSDGTAIVGYAGLGATALGNQPSQWVSNVLRGRHHPLESMLKVVADAMQREFLPHLRQIRDVRLRRHSFVIPAYVDGGSRVYSIDLADSATGPMFRYTRYIMGDALESKVLTPPIAFGGSGSSYLVGDARWRRTLLRLVNAYNRKAISSQAVCEHLARLNVEVHKNTVDGSVGPDSLIIWRNSKSGAHRGGGGHFFYEGTKRSNSHPALPSIMNGIDMFALVDMLQDVVTKPMMDAMRTAKGESEPKVPALREDEMNRRLSQLPQKPDEKLR